eukprot:scaffold86045_cov69-Phaeocystis_antarctica.AAC.2
MRSAQWPVIAAVHEPPASPLLTLLLLAPQASTTASAPEPPPRPITRAPRRPLRSQRPPRQTQSHAASQPAVARNPRRFLVQRQYSANTASNITAPSMVGQACALRRDSDGGGPAKHTLHAADDVLGLIRGQESGPGLGSGSGLGLGPGLGSGSVSGSVLVSGLVSGSVSGFSSARVGCRA